MVNCHILCVYFFIIHNSGSVRPNCYVTLIPGHFPFCWSTCISNATPYIHPPPSILLQHTYSPPSRIPLPVTVFSSLVGHTYAGRLVDTLKVGQLHFTAGVFFGAHRHASR